MVTEHKLQFEVAPYHLNVDPDITWQMFRVGTCEGLWSHDDKSYMILAIENKQPGNGHFTDVLQWFEYSCRRDKRSLKIMQVWNSRLKRHLINKGFKDIGNDNVELKFN